MTPDDLLQQAKAANDVYQTAWKLGYEAGFKDACDRALEILNKPIRKYNRKENGDATE
jgi:hypothetical protein